MKTTFASPAHGNPVEKPVALERLASMSDDSNRNGSRIRERRTRRSKEIFYKVAPTKQTERKEDDDQTGRIGGEREAEK